MNRCVLSLVFVFGISTNTLADDAFFPRDGQRIVFLGDSNTYSRLYVSYIEAYLFTRYPDKKFEILCLGLPSETVSGLSEPDHPYPRPDVHERLDRVLAKTKPDVVVACYGMNDGIYYPFADERFKKYQHGIERLAEKAEKAGAKVVLITPPPFDPRPIKDQVQDNTAEKFSWVKPYGGYDDVLTKYSQWLLTLREKGRIVADSHGAIDRYLTERRRDDAKFHIAGAGVHFNATGHALVAEQLLVAWHAPANVDRVEIDAKSAKAVTGTVEGLSIEKDAIRFTWTSHLPMPADPDWDPKFAATEKFNERINRYRMLVNGAPRPKYELFEGDKKLGVVKREQLADGVDLLQFKELTTNRRAAELSPLVDQRQRLLGPAWLTDIGHMRPDTPKGQPLDEAKREAAQLETKIREMAKPVKLKLRLVAVD